MLVLVTAVVLLAGCAVASPSGKEASSQGNSIVNLVLLGFVLRWSTEVVDAVLLAPD